MSHRHFSHPTISIPAKITPSTTSTVPLTTLPSTTTPTPTPSQPATAKVVAGSSDAAGGSQPTASPGNIGSSGGHLVLGGQPYQFVGVNAYEIATDWGVNGSCGTMVNDGQLDQLFSSLPPNSLVRFWAWQGSAAININTHQIDWAPLDRIFAAAADYHQRRIVVLAGQSGDCDGGNWKDPAWYAGGFMQPNDANGLTPLSYWTYMQDVVDRYKTSPALGMWEPISEPEASTCPPQFQPSNCGGNQTCPNEAVAEQAMLHFFDVVGGEIHALDPDHLVESGMIGNGQCGTSGPDYAAVSASPGIDVLSYHDYTGPTLMPGDQWNGLALRFQEAAALRKPIIGGEVGITSGVGSCTSPTLRAQQFQAKEDAQVAAGSSGLLAWDWEPSSPSGCAFDTYPGDPLMAVIGQGPPG